MLLETVSDFIFLGSKITTDGDCSHEIKRHSLEGMGKQWKQCQTLFFWAPKSLQMVTAAMKLKNAYSLEGEL